VLLHGFPEIWYSWRHQISALAGAGYHVVVPDQRGFGQTDSPAGSDYYTQLHLVGDLIGLLDALGEETAFVAGHDYGAPVAWNAARMRPDRVQGVIALSVPYIPRGKASLLQEARAWLGDGFYMVYYQHPGVAEAEFERDVRTTVRKLMYAGSGDSVRNELWTVLPDDRGMLHLVDDPATLPAWLTEADVDYYTEAFKQSGFTGGLNWYRAIDKSWEVMAPFSGAKVTTPALFIAGENDPLLALPGSKEAIVGMLQVVPNLKGTIMLPGVGHWTQQERPAEVTAAMLDFLRSF
jgi:pimeloyl-ACP methyl ester carboxylesterase